MKSHSIFVSVKKNIILENKKTDKYLIWCSDLRFTWKEWLDLGSETRPSLHRLPLCLSLTHRIASSSLLYLTSSAPLCPVDKWYQNDMQRLVSCVLMEGLISLATLSSSLFSPPVLLGASLSVSCMWMKFPGLPAGGSKRQKASSKEAFLQL